MAKFSNLERISHEIVFIFMFMLSQNRLNKTAANNQSGRKMLEKCRRTNFT